GEFTYAAPDQFAHAYPRSELMSTCDNDDAAFYAELIVYAKATDGTRRVGHSAWDGRAFAIAKGAVGPPGGGGP
ncbi:MAG: hypothetical protein ACYTG6_16335, partial [Planctomycetota bacterium]